MQYEAMIDSDTLAMQDARTSEPLDAVAVIPTHAPDLAALVRRVPRELAGELARLAAWRAIGGDGAPPARFDA